MNYKLILEFHDLSLNDFAHPARNVRLALRELERRHDELPLHMKEQLLSILNHLSQDKLLTSREIKDLIKLDGLTIRMSPAAWFHMFVNGIEVAEGQPKGKHVITLHFKGQGPYRKEYVITNRDVTAQLRQELMTECDLLSQSHLTVQEQRKLKTLNYARSSYRTTEGSTGFKWREVQTGGVVVLLKNSGKYVVSEDGVDTKCDTFDEAFLIVKGLLSEFDRKLDF